ncbi:MAG: hypothetical protein ACREQ5_11005, partial [Candidatus Dormibacteria bacterium]
LENISDPIRYMGKLDPYMFRTYFREPLAQPENPTWGQRNISPALDAIDNWWNGSAGPLSGGGTKLRAAAQRYADARNALLPRGIAPGPARATGQFVRNGGMHLLQQGAKTVGGAAAILTIPQAKDAKIDINKYSTIRPFNAPSGKDSLGGTYSIAATFPYTGSEIAAYLALPHVRGPYLLDPNGALPNARISATPTDPTGPKSFVPVWALRALGAEAGIAGRLGTNNESLTAGYVWRGPGAFIGNLRGDVPLQKGAPRGLNALYSASTLLPQEYASLNLGPFALMARGLQATYGANAQTSALSAGSKAGAYRFGQRTTFGTNEPSMTEALLGSVNPAYNPKEPSFDPSATRALNLFNARVSPSKRDSSLGAYRDTPPTFATNGPSRHNATAVMNPSYNAEPAATVGRVPRYSILRPVGP